MALPDLLLSHLWLMVMMLWMQHQEELTAQPQLQQAVHILEPEADTKALDILEAPGHSALHTA